MRFCSAPSMMSCTSLAVGLASGDFETHLHQRCKRSKLLDHKTLLYVQEAAQWSAVPPLCDDALCKHHGLSNKHLCWDSLSLESPLVTATIAPQKVGTQWEHHNAAGHCRRSAAFTSLTDLSGLQFQQGTHLAPWSGAAALDGLYPGSQSPIAPHQSCRCQPASTRAVRSGKHSEEALGTPQASVHAIPWCLCLLVSCDSKCSSG